MRVPTGSRPESLSNAHSPESKPTTVASVPHDDSPHEAAAATAVTLAREVMELGASSSEEKRDPENDAAPISPKLVQIKDTVPQ